MDRERWKCCQCAHLTTSTHSSSFGISVRLTLGARHWREEERSTEQVGPQFRTSKMSSTNNAAQATNICYSLLTELLYLVSKASLPKVQCKFLTLYLACKPSVFLSPPSLISPGTCARTYDLRNVIIQMVLGPHDRALLPALLCLCQTSTPLWSFLNRAANL